MADFFLGAAQRFGVFPMIGALDPAGLLSSFNWNHSVKGLPIVRRWLTTLANESVCRWGSENMAGAPSSFLWLAMIFLYLYPEVD